MSEFYEEREPQPDDPVNVFIVSRVGRAAARRVLWQMTRQDAQECLHGPSHSR